MSEEHTLEMPSRGLDDDKRKWARRVERCETDLCFHGYKIGGLRQGGRYVVIIHAEPVDHMCSFRGEITEKMAAYYNSNPAQMTGHG